MRVVAIFAILLLCLLPAYAQLNPVSLNVSKPTELLKGTPKSMTERHFQPLVRDGVVSKGAALPLSLITTTYFRTDGQYSDIYEYRLDGGLASHSAFRYKNGHLVQRTDSIFSDGSCSVTVRNYVYDYLGRLVSDSRKSADQKNTMRHQYKYDEYGHCVEELTYDHKGVVVDRVQYSFNEQHNLIDGAGYHATTMKGSSLRYVFDTHGRLTSSTLDDDEGFSSRDTNTFDDKGFLIYTQSNSMRDGKKYYDFAACYQYLDFDQRGNWVLKIVRRGNPMQPVEVVDRTFQY